MFPFLQDVEVHLMIGKTFKLMHDEIRVYRNAFVVHVGKGLTISKMGGRIEDR